MKPSLRFSSEVDSLLAEGAEIVVGGFDQRGWPCICRARTSIVEDGHHAVLVLDRAEGAEVLDAILGTRRVAILISARDSLRSIQLKGLDARILSGAARRRALIRNRPDVSRVDAIKSDPDAACPRGRPVPQELVAFRFRVAGSGTVDARRQPGPVDASAGSDAPSMPLPEPVRRLLEDDTPITMCVVSVDGMPHLARIASLVCIDGRHIAISLLSEHAARVGLLASGSAALCLVDPDSGAAARLRATYLRTELSGPAFDRLQTKVATTAWLSGVRRKRLRSDADILKVDAVQSLLDCEPAPIPRVPLTSLTELRRLSDRICRCDSSANLVDVTLSGLDMHLGMACSILWLLETRRQSLVLFASHGYPMSDVGAELPLGHGLAGIAADAALPVRIARVRLPATRASSARERGRTPDLPAGGAIAWTGLESPSSQLAVPLLVQGRVVGALFVEGWHARRFGAEDEDALCVIAGQFAASLAMLSENSTPGNVVVTDGMVPSADLPIEIRYHRHDSSVFLDGRYLIKGVAGALFWKLVRAYVQGGLCEFSTRELRRCTSELRLPEVRDNLYTRLLILQRRLSEHAAPVRIERTGRGRFRLSVDRALKLADDEIRAA